MRVVHINKSDLTGGAAVAASRIVSALRLMEVDATLLVAEKKSKNSWVESILHSRKDKIKLTFNFLYDILSFLPHEKNKRGRFAFSLARRGFNLSNHPSIKNADIIHLHWFNHGFLSLKGLKAILELGKPIVWTLHDMWSFTGGCHYSGGCTNFKQSCGQCPMLLEPRDNDLSALQHLRKMKMYKNAPLTFVTCSNWLGQLANSSSLAREIPIQTIHNPINTDLFAPASRIDARRKLGLPLDKMIILFGAANVLDPRKGMKLLIHALNELTQKSYRDQIELVIFGKTPSDMEEQLPFPATLMHYVSKTDTLVNLYNAADLFVLPSLEDNLPNTVMESLACGTPIAAFRIGGVPEMVAHGTCGYLAS
ncbi:MAG TPA: glycosyltransferase, partial [Marinilabiliaceae bacterium]|nr:glycosyltransferase [Marinilabiliaceae bacterium]